MNSVSKKYRTAAPYGRPAYRNRVWVVLLLIVAVLAAGCASSGGSAGQGGTEPTVPPLTPERTLTPEPPTSTTSPAGPAPSPGAVVPGRVLDEVKTRAAQRAGVDPSQVEIVSSTLHTWNDGSLGCPQPGMNYIQVVTEGYQIIARAGGRTFDFRTSPNAVKLCE
jgi:hypothetical protein